MRTKQITELEAASTSADADKLLVVQNGTTCITTKADILAATTSAISALEARIVALEAASHSNEADHSHPSSPSASSSGCVQDPSYALPTSGSGGGDNYHFAEADRPLVIALQTTQGTVAGETYRMHVYDTGDGRAQLKELDGTAVGWINGRGTKWEILDCG